ncbi:hypothetical protein MRX96_016845 [Rhipicephalus microplus]
MNRCTAVGDVRTFRAAFIFPLETQCRLSRVARSFKLRRCHVSSLPYRTAFVSFGSPVASARALRVVPLTGSPTSPMTAELTFSSGSADACTEGPPALSMIRRQSFRLR